MTRGREQRREGGSNCREVVNIPGFGLAERKFVKKGEERASYLSGLSSKVRRHGRWVVGGDEGRCTRSEGAHRLGANGSLENQRTTAHKS